MVRRDPRTKRWFFRTTIWTRDGKKDRAFGTPGVWPYHDLANTAAGAREAEQRAIQNADGEAPHAAASKKVPSFKEWFWGRFWREWVVSRKNKPSEVNSKKSIMKLRLEPEFGEMALDKIDTSTIAEFRAKLVDAKLSDKTINNYLAVLSKALKYAAEIRVIDHAPSVGLFKVERPEILAWNIEQYARILAAAKTLNSVWYAATCLAGEAGLRIGEIRALDWERDVDLIAATITINRQLGEGNTTTPKGRTRRTIPMTPTLLAALEALGPKRTGYVICNIDGSPWTDGQCSWPCVRIRRTARLPHRAWHTLRHAFGTHAAMFGANPWKLMNWMGHKRIEETMLYVHFAEAHMRPHPEQILAAQKRHEDPDRKIIAMLDARHLCVPHDTPEPGDVVATANEEHQAELVIARQVAAD